MTENFAAVRASQEQIEAAFADRAGTFEAYCKRVDAKHHEALETAVRDMRAEKAGNTEEMVRELARNLKDADQLQVHDRVERYDYRQILARLAALEEQARE